MALIYIESPDQVNIYYDEKKKRVRCTKREDGTLLFEVHVKKVMPLTPGYFHYFTEEEGEEVERLGDEKFGFEKPWSSRGGAFIQAKSGTYIFWDGMGPLLRESGIARWGCEFPA
ncbi:MAG: hypothetical protein Q4A17_04170 [Thermoguttaceae bacterium]|nr:hypothetical protein [Thermoguttaceae bacterium]